jgi:hypothetical protein
MTTEYVVTSDRLSRPKGGTFTDDELGSAVDGLVAGGHLQVKRTGQKATDKKEG